MSTKVRKWRKVVEILDPEEIRALSEKDKQRLLWPYLEVRVGVRKTSFRVNYRQGDIGIRKTLGKEFSDLKHWRKAYHRAGALIGEAEYGEKPLVEKADVRSEKILDDLVTLKKSKSEETYRVIEKHVRLHLKPFMNGQCAYVEEGETCPHSSYLEAGACPYAKSFTPPVWLNYKTHYRLHRPDASLYNHWKFFIEFAKHIFDQGLIPRKLKLPFDPKKEEFRKRGMVIPDDHFQRMVRAANPAWRDRMVFQRLTGQRPGLVRKLRKDRYDRARGLLRIQKVDSKNRRAYEFTLPRPAIEILERRLASDSPYFFPSVKNPGKPMGEQLGGWNGALRRAFPDETPPEYTPHDLRHTRLTELFRTPGINHALTCYQHDLSLKEAMETYIHFDAKDTAVIAADAEARANALLSGLETAIPSEGPADEQT